MNTLQELLGKQLDLKISKSFLLDEKTKARILSVTSSMEEQITKISANIVAFLKNSRAIKDQFTKSLVADLEKIIPNGLSGAGAGGGKKYYNQNIKVNEFASIY